MATYLKWDGDGLTPGSAVTTSTAGPGDTAPSAVVGTPTIDASGARPPRIKHTQGAGVASYATWSHTADGTMAARWYTRFSGFPSSSFTIAQGLLAGSQRWRLDLAGSGGSPAGELRLRNSANTQISDSGALGVPLNTELRVDLTLNADVLTAWIFESDSLTELFSVSGTVHAGATADSIRIGNVLAGVQAPTFYVDDVRVDDVAVRIGPAGAPAFPTYKQWDGVSEVPLTLQGVWDGVSVVPLTFGQLT